MGSNAVHLSDVLTAISLRVWGCLVEIGSILAQSDPSTGVEPKARAKGLMLIAIIVAIGLVGMLTVFLLFVTWRRFNKRYSSKESMEPMPDVWRVGGARLAAAVDTEIEEEKKLRVQEEAARVEAEMDELDDESEPPPLRGWDDSDDGSQLDEEDPRWETDAESEIDDPEDDERPPFPDDEPPHSDDDSSFGPRR